MGSKKIFIADVFHPILSWVNIHSKVERRSTQKKLLESFSTKILKSLKETLKLGLGAASSL